MTRRRRYLGRIAPVLALALLAGTNAPCLADLGNAPQSSQPIVLTTRAGQPFNLSELNGRTRIVIFGEADQPRTLLACSEIAELLASPLLAGEDIGSVLVVTRTDALKAIDLGNPALAELVLLDPGRDAFGAYRVIVMPTIVVLDAEGRTVHTMPGFLPRHETIITAAALLAQGKLTRDEFAGVLDPAPTVKPSAEALRAARLTNMAERMRQEGLLDIAAKRFTEALQLEPGLVRARMGLGWTRLDQQRPAEARDQFQAALDADTDSIDARLGLGYADAAQGGELLDRAETAARAIITSTPSAARAHHLLGVVHQQRGEFESAMLSYLRAAELLLDRPCP